MAIAAGASPTKLSPRPTAHVGAHHTTEETQQEGAERDGADECGTDIVQPISEL